jgi:hypothetical protein
MERPPDVSIRSMSRRKRYTRNFGRKLPQPAPYTVEWVRFEHEREPYGVFSYLNDAADKLPRRQLAELSRLRRWFCTHLDAPSDDDGLDQERFWFRAEASEYLDRARRMAELISRAGFPIVERRRIEHRPDLLARYRDPYQIAILPRYMNDRPLPVAANPVLEAGHPG